MTDIRRCSDPECRGHDLDRDMAADDPTNALEILPPGATPEQREWADRINGKQYGYPACCVQEYLADQRAGRYPWGTRMQEIPGLDRCPTARPDLYLGYVPCRACARRLLGED